MKTTINNQQIFNIKSVEQQWKDIPGYEDIYQISDMGNVRSLDRTITDVKGNIREYKGKELAKIVNTAGYLYVNLYACLTISLIPSFLPCHSPIKHTPSP